MEDANVRPAIRDGMGSRRDGGSGTGTWTGLLPPWEERPWDELGVYLEGVGERGEEVGEEA